MKRNRKRLAALLLCLVMLLSLLPAVFAEEETAQDASVDAEEIPAAESAAPEEAALPLPEDTDTPAAEETAVPEPPQDLETAEETQDPEPSDAPEESGDPDAIPEDPDAEPEGEAAGAAPVRVVFETVPEDAVIRVYSPAQPDEDADPLPLEPQEDGSWLLEPGEYLYDAEAEGYLAQAGIVFRVTEQADGAEQEIFVYLDAEEPPESEPAVRVVFYRDPEDLTLDIYAPAPDDEGGLRRIEPERDGSFRLAPGEYSFSARCPGYIDVDFAPFTIGEEYLDVDEMRIDIVLIPSNEGMSPAASSIPPARPLPNLSGNRALDVVNIANSQVGYAASSGGTVYGAWWTNVTNWGYDYSRADWCAMFVCWCANQAGAGLNVAYNLNGASTSLLLDWYKNRGQANVKFTANPQPGDFLFFTNHVGLVTGYDTASQTVYFVAGNEGGTSGSWSTTSRVNRGSVRWGRNVYRNGNQLLGYGRPNYQDVYYNPDPNGYTVAFVQRCYSLILGREGDADGVASWSGQLRSGLTTGASVVNGFLSSPEFAARGLNSEEIIRIVYDVMLEREADAEGLASWSKLLESGVSYGYIVNGFASSAEFQDLCSRYGILPGNIASRENRDQNPDITAFVSRCYRLMMNREPDVSGLNDWCGHLIAGRRTGATLVDAFLTSEEFRGRGLSTADAVEILYRVMLDRPSDPSGKADWVSYVEAGTTLRYVVAGFAASSEFKKVCASYGIKPGTLSELDWRDRNGPVTKFVARCYRNALERPGEAAGLNDWCERLLRKWLTPKQVAEQFVFSDECVRRYLSDESFVELLYHLYMGREPDEAGKADWLRSISRGMSRRQVAEAFANSAEFRGIVKSYGL